MNGVEILYEEKIVTATTFNWEAFWTAALVLFGVFLLIALFLSWSDGWNCTACAFVSAGVLGLLVGGAVGWYFGDKAGIPTEHETQYKVIVEDNVSLTEFLDRYKILNREGEIYIVRDKEDQK